MLSDEEIRFIGENYSKIYSIYETGSTEPFVWEWLKKTYPMSCWTCRNKIKTNIASLLNTYVKQIRTGSST